MKKQLIIDCDNTMGLAGRDIDDGMAILYLLGREDVEILGITLTYGNGTIDEVEKAHQEFTNRFNLHHIPVYSRADAANFLKDSVNNSPKQISILALGSMTNLCEASKLDPKFYNNVQHITIMGGICEPIILDGHTIDELNLSCNANAAYSVLTSDASISILNGHSGLDAFMDVTMFNELLSQNGEFFSHIKELSSDWLNKMAKLGTKGFVNWDTAAAILWLHPEWFTNDEVHINPTVNSLQTGMLQPVPVGNKKVFMPRNIKDTESFNNHICKTITDVYNKYFV